VACVLVGDGCSADRAALRKAVEQTGLFERVLEAADGLRALRLLLAEPVDVVVCDLDLPQLDGEKLLRTRLESRVGEPCFLFVTAGADPDRCVRLLDLGAHDVIAKPYHSAELGARIARQLRLHRLQQELREKNSELARLSSSTRSRGCERGATCRTCSRSRPCARAATALASSCSSSTSTSSSA